MDGIIFNHLICNWKISNGPPDIPNSCTLNFYVGLVFELKKNMNKYYFNIRKIIKKGYFEKLIYFYDDDDDDDDDDDNDDDDDD